MGKHLLEIFSDLLVLYLFGISTLRYYGQTKAPTAFAKSQATDFNIFKNAIIELSNSNIVLSRSCLIPPALSRFQTYLSNRKQILDAALSHGGSARISNSSQNGWLHFKPGKCSFRAPMTMLLSPPVLPGEGD